jgi:hypothetical protein
MSVAYQNLEEAIFTDLNKGNSSGTSTWRRELVDTFEHSGRYKKAGALLVNVFE